MISINQIKGTILLGLIALVGLSSCGVYQKYEAPKIETEGLFRDTLVTDSTTIASLSWNEYFTDPLLQALIEEGLTNNIDLQIATARIHQAEAGLNMSKSAYYPTVALTGQFSQTRMSSVDPLTMKPTGETKILKYHTEQYSLGLGVSWEADIWGKIGRQKRSSYAKFLGSQEYKNLAQTNIIAGIATSYYTLLSLDEQLRVSNEAIALLEETVKTMEAMKEAFLLNAAAVEQTKSSLYNTKVSIPDLEMAIRQLENTLCGLIGRNSGKIGRSTFSDQTTPSELKVGLPIQMLSNRPDVRAAELSLRSAFELQQAAKANFYPSISLNTGSFIGFGFISLSDLLKPENIIANILAGITQPLFARGQIKANYQVAKAEQEVALLNFRKMVLEASQEVSDILYTYESSLKKTDLRDQQIESLKKSVEYTQLLLKASEANYLEVITAEQNLLQAQLGQIKDKLQQLQSSVNLYKALGGGVK